MTTIIRKPRRLYPLPDNLKELDRPWSEENYGRYARVDIFQEGYKSGDDPTRKSPAISPSSILSKL